ncbi:MAG: MBOAT family protein [Pseudomonadota bacterium]
MLFNSYEFLLLLSVTLALYYLFEGAKQRVAILILASLTFYGWWNYIYLALLLGSVLCNFWISRLLVGQGRKGLWLAIGIVFNLALLAFFKYADFVISSINILPAADLALLHIALPLAISFFTFQQIAFLVDQYKSKPAFYRFTDYLLFVSFFPQLIAGPIVHHREMMPQFKKRLIASDALVNLSAGLALFALGLFKKTILADQFAIYADGLFDGVDGGSGPTAVDAWIGSIAYSLQIYFDFSGYTDMALGIARMFGIRLPLNFFSPYKARSIVDFWRRWHITLSRFLRDYLYIPLGGNRKGAPRRYANLMITMLLGGLWHGAGWTFVIWGGLHGLYLVINHAWNELTATGRPLAALEGTGRLIGPALTFIAVVIAWVFFRAESFEDASQVLQGMAGINGLIGEGGLPVFADVEALFWLAGGLAIVWFAPNSLQIMRRYRPAIDPSGITTSAPAPKGISGRLTRAIAWRPTVPWAIASGVMAAAAMLTFSKVSPFLYFQF